MDTHEIWSWALATARTEAAMARVEMNFMAVVYEEGVVESGRGV